MSAAWSALNPCLWPAFPSLDTCPISFRPFATTYAFQMYYARKIGRGLWQLLDGFTLPSLDLTLGRPEDRSHLLFELRL